MKKNLEEQFGKHMIIPFNAHVLCFLNATELGRCVFRVIPFGTTAPDEQILQMTFDYGNGISTHIVDALFESKESLKEVEQADFTTMKELTWLSSIEANHSVMLFCYQGKDNSTSYAMTYVSYDKEDQKESIRDSLVNGPVYEIPSTIGNFF